MEMNKDLARTQTQEKRKWQRVTREKALQHKIRADHSREFATQIDAQKGRARQKAKIDTLNRT